jgi:cell pole-organizing protein PopZ
MNRADQAPEPSMEELLASIRLIISDADKRSPLAREPGPSLSIPPAAAQPSFAGDEVLDLTDELVFPEEKGSMPMPAGPEPTPRQLSEPLQSSEARNRAAVRPAPAGSSAAGRADPAAGQAPSRPIWSRREVPFPGAPFEFPMSKPRQDPGQAKSPSRSWSGDIQMAVPEQGPVSLVSSAEQEPPGLGEAATDSARAEAALGGDHSQTGGLEEDGEASVAALAHKLARSAVGSMDASELATAQDVDFEHIDENSRAEVTEKFADAIERENAALNKPALPSLLDEVLRQDFRRESFAAGNDQELPEPAALKGSPDPIRFASRHSSATKEEKLAQPSPATVQPVAQSQALVPAQAPTPAQPIRSLEDAVREMLRPLLVQWLNENMPRILESAIREEIAARGLIPGSER